MKRLLITGATGFLGSRLTRYLSKSGYEVFPVIRSHYAGHEFEKMSCLIYDGKKSSITKFFDCNSIDCVIHLAASYSEESAFESNICFPAELFDIAAGHGCNKFLNTGTYWQFDSEGNRRANSLYAQTKQEFENILQNCCTKYSISAITLILMDVYGPNDLRGKLINQIAYSLKYTTPIAMSSGYQMLDFIHVEDVLRAYLVALDHLKSIIPGEHQEYFVASGMHISVRELVSLAEKIALKKVIAQWGERLSGAGEISKAYIGKILPAWTPEILLEDGLKGILCQ